MNSSINVLLLHALSSMPQLKFYRRALYCIVKFDKVSDGKIVNSLYQSGKIKQARDRELLCCININYYSAYNLFSTTKDTL